MKRLKFIQLMIFWGSISSGFAQTSLEGGNYTSLPIFPKSPPSPEVASLGKFGDIPINLSKGTMSYNVPIYTINLKELAVPVSIDYHTSGIKVNEHSSVAGLGWALNAGGVVQSSVNGLDDLSSNGWRTGQFKLPMGSNFPLKVVGWDGFSDWESDPHQMLMYEASKNEIDTQPDLFYYSFLGENGKFVLDTLGNALLIPFKKLKIQIGISGCTITDETGNIFEFSEVESSITTSMDYGKPEFTPQNMAYSFHLKKITTIYGEEVNFIYDHPSYSFKNGRVETRYSFGSSQSGCISNRPTSYFTESTTFVVTPRLKEINSNKGHKITLEYLNQRSDLNGSSSLSRIRVFNGINPNIITFNFYHSYFGNSSSSDPDAKRLKLDSIKRDLQPAYKFYYNNPAFVPHRLSMAQDHWGYFNNAGNTTMLPVDVSNGFNNGGSREVNEAAAKYGALEKIVYPTGGFTTIEYESNNFYDGSSNRKIGGLRVKKVRDHSWDSPPVVTTYEYGIETNPSRSSGLNLFTPVYSYPHYWENKNMDSGELFDCLCMAQTSRPISDIGLGNSGGVSYGTVTVKKGENNEGGKTVHTYGGYKTYVGINAFPFGPTISNDWAAYNPTEIKEFKFEDGGFVLTKKSNFIYKDNFSLDPSFQSLPNEQYIRGVKIALNRPGIKPCIPASACPSPRGPEYLANYFVYYSSWYYLKESHETFYNDAEEFTIVKKYYYDNPTHGFVTREASGVFSDSGQDSLIIIKKYPMDYHHTVNSAITKMVEMNVVRKPIEIQELKKKSGQTYFLDGIISVPSLINSKPFFKQFYKPEISIPILASSINYPKSGMHYTSIFPTSSNNFKLKAEIQNFDNFGNIQDLKLNAGLTTESNLWDYNKTYITAKIHNALVSEIAYTSFETGQKGGWNYSGSTLTVLPKTGKRCYNLSNGNITKSGIPASANNRYKLSFWARRNSGSGTWTFLGIPEDLDTNWKLIEREITNPNITISGPGIFVDELRLHPSSAKLETFTYDPNVGVTSIADSKNSIKVFTYDTIGRLKGILNDQGEFLEYFDYKYYKQ